MLLSLKVEILSFKPGGSRCFQNICSGWQCHKWHRQRRQSLFWEEWRSIPSLLCLIFLSNATLSHETTPWEKRLESYCLQFWKTELRKEIRDWREGKTKYLNFPQQLSKLVGLFHFHGLGFSQTQSDSSLHSKGMTIGSPSILLIPQF